MASRTIVLASGQPALSVRRIILIIWMSILAMTPYERLGALPQVMFEPVGVMAVMHSQAPVTATLLRYDALLFLRLSGLLAIFVALCARRRDARCVGMSVAFASVLILDSVAKSVGGYVNHAQALPVIILGLVTTGEIFEALDQVRQRQATAWCGADPPAQSTDEFVRWASGITLVMAYTFTGVNRLVYGGAEALGGDALLTQMMVATYQYSAFGFHVAPDIVDTVWGRGLVRAGFVGVTALEVLAGGVFYRTWSRTLWLLGMSVFHVSTLVLMNIFFWENLLLIWCVLGRKELYTASRALAMVFFTIRR